MKRLIAWLKSRFSRKKEPGPVAFVWLLDEPRLLDAPTIQRIVEQELGVSITSEPKGDEPMAEAGNFVVGQPPNFVVHIDEHMLLLNCLPVPYMQNPERAAERIEELRLRKAVAEHRAWVSADLLGEYEGEALEKGLGIIGRLAAALADNRCLALYLPHADRLVPYDPELLSKLREPNPMQALGWEMSPVVSISGDDPAMKGAVAEARERWPEFVEAFRSPKPGQEHFAVKLPITDGKNTEFIWVSVASIEGDEILGDLANQPVDLRFMKEGDRVRGKLEDLNDWAWLEGEEMVGGFTSKVLMEAQRRR
jgi:uncharacterized protein YegJ (DUF2314 family)